MIGNAKESDGLYYFGNEDLQEKQVQKPGHSSFLSLDNEIMLWHFRLAHPSFGYLQHLFPTLFKNKDINSF